ncbi:MAG TPA: histidine kinase, partial [Porticoccaceae bacterium]|nr:histidine kinase [Porticoccaceae bacterium]
EAIDEWQKKGNTPKENWWGLQRVLYYDKKDYRRVVGVLKKLIKHYPKYSYWRQLGGMYGELDQEINQLITNEVLYLAGVELKEKELLGLAYLFIGADSPYLAAKVVEKGIKDSVIPVTSKNMEFLGHAWQQAQEGDKARSALEQAAKLSDQGKIWARLAGVYLDIGDDKKAVRASRNALNKGGLKRNDLTYMVLGNAQLNLNCYNDAIKAFEKASQDKRSRKFADKWIEYSRREGARREKLIEMGANIAGCTRA